MIASYILYRWQVDRVKRVNTSSQCVRLVLNKIEDLQRYNLCLSIARAVPVNRHYDGHTCWVTVTLLFTCTCIYTMDTLWHVYQQNKRRRLSLYRHSVFQCYPLECVRGSDVVYSMSILSVPSFPYGPVMAAFLGLVYEGRMRVSFTTTHGLFPFSFSRGSMDCRRRRGGRTNRLLSNFYAIGICCHYS